MQFYVSKCNDNLNGKPYFPELINSRICLNPYYRVNLAENVKPHIIIDSGAFQDVGNDSRLTFKEALDRQLKFEKKFNNGYKAEAIVSYDHLVDEQLDLTKGQIKKRVSRKIANDYVMETIEAAEFLSKKRKKLGKRKLILSCQGISIPQYLKCLDNVLSVTENNDIIGFGGFCIISKKIKYEQQYYNILRKAVPKLKEANIKRLHIFGVGLFRALVQTDIFTRIHGIETSYDTSSQELNGTFGRVFCPMGPNLTTVYNKVHKKKGYHPADLALFNTCMIRNFWEEHQKLPLPKTFSPKYTPARRKYNKKKT